MSKSDLAGVLCDRIVALHSSVQGTPPYDAAAASKETPR
jgi:hypothetical protein